MTPPAVAVAPAPLAQRPARRARAAAARADDRLAARVAGCYALDPGPWRRDAFIGRPYPSGAPTRFRLSAERFAAGEDRPHMLPVTGRAYGAAVVPGPGSDTAYVGPGASPFWRWEYWQRVRPDGDTLIVTRVESFSGVDLLLAPSGRDLAGRIEVYTDVHHPGVPHRVTRPVRARRIACAPPGSGAARGAGA